MNKSCKIVLEAGSTINGLDSAIQLVDVASGSGADAIKFMFVDANRQMGDRSVMFSYGHLVDKETNQIVTVTEPLIDITKRRELKKEEWIKLKKYVDSKGLEFNITLTYADQLDFLINELKANSIKIGSSDVNNLPYIKNIARKCKHSSVALQIDTGSSTIGEVERAIEVLEKEGHNDIVIHHCPSGYPAQLESINLRIISTLKQLFNYPIAFSDHSPGWTMDIAAVTLGVDLIEKTITLDRTIRSPEHCMSLEPKEVMEFVKTIREVEIALGVKRRIVSETEAQNRLSRRRSLYTLRDIQEGEKITEENTEYKRPGYGISPIYHDVVIGRTAKRKISINTAISWDDV